jgi:ribokinase
VAVTEVARGGVVVVGQMGRDLILHTDGLPGAGGSATILRRLEQLGGKGANQAVGLSQLGVPVAIVGVVGDDAEGTDVLSQACRDGIDVANVARRGTTALLVDLVDRTASRRLFEDVPNSSLVTVDDVERSAAMLRAASVVSIQLQQPADTALAAARLARDGGARTVVDGAPRRGLDDDLLALTDAIRADAAEAELIAGTTVESPRDAQALGERLLGAGPRLVALAVPGVGDLVTWRLHGVDDSRLFPYADDVTVVDPTGAGDAFVAAMVSALFRGDDPVRAGALAAAAAGSTVQRLGGRPDLSALRSAG